MCTSVVICQISKPTISTPTSLVNDVTRPTTLRTSLSTTATSITVVWLCPCSGAESSRARERTAQVVSRGVTKGLLFEFVRSIFVSLSLAFIKAFSIFLYTKSSKSKAFFASSPPPKKVILLQWCICCTHKLCLIKDQLLKQFVSLFL